MGECKQIRAGCAHAFKELTGLGIIHTEQLAEIRDDQKEIKMLLRGNGRDGLETRVTRIESSRIGRNKDSDKTWKIIAVGVSCASVLVALLAVMA